MNPQYIDYNPCTVVIGGSYTITNIQKEGIPDKGCGAHLESLEISAPPVGAQEGAGQVGAQGSITVIDYKDSVYSLLSEHLDNYMHNGNDNSFLPTISITIECFTGKQTWTGHIIDWSVQFTGTTPSLTLNWSSILPTSGEGGEAIPKGTKYETVNGFLDAVRTAYGEKNDIPIVMKDGTAVSSDNLQFKADQDGAHVLIYNLPTGGSSGNYQIDAYRYLLSNAETTDGKAIRGYYDQETKKFIVEYKQAKDNDQPTEAGKISGGLIFVQNGKFKPYTKDDQGRIVIPITSFSYNAKMSQLALQGKMLQSPNGTTVAPTQGGASPSQSNNPNGTSTGMVGNADQANGVRVSFECYNVLSFSMNNINEKVSYMVYNEFGKRHPLSGMGTVQECKYSLSGGVVKASISATEEFGTGSISQSGSTGVEPSNTAAAEADSGVGDSYTDSGDNSTQTYTEYKDTSNMSYEAYLRQEDEFYVPLSCDKTQECLNNGTFGKHVDEFLDRYGNLKSTSRRLDYSFIKKLIQAGDIGLLAALFGPAHYGVKDPPKYWGEDPVMHDPGHKKIKSSPYCAGQIGKLPFDHTTGGIGLAHWDAENLDDIYSTCGFDPGIDRDHIAKLIVGIPTKEKDKKKFTGYVSGWKEGTYRGHRKIFPIFKGKCYMRRFDRGLKQDAKWVAWARDLVYYNGSDGRIYQHYLMQLWLKKFWFRTMSNLKGKPAVGGHVPCLQDAVRISRAGNSRTGWIYPMCGKNVSQQYDIYKSNGSISHAMKQKAYCKRLCQILMWEYKAGNLKP